MKRCSLTMIIALLGINLLLMGGCEERQMEGTSAQVREDNSPQTRLVFLFFSDTQENPGTGDGSNYEKLLAQAMARSEEPELAIFGGDTVNNGGDDSQWQEFWRISSSFLTGLTTAAVPGNHDSHKLLAQQFDYPKQAPSGQGDGYFYSFDLGPVHFIMLDSNIMGAANEKDVEWLRKDLQSAEAGQASWRIAVMHHPMWPLGENPKDIQRALTMREHFLPLLEAYGVELILCGHQHLYGRTLSMSGERISADRTGIVQIMAASGDKESYSAGDLDYIAASFSSTCYLLLKADGEELSITAYDSENNMIDICTMPLRQR